MASDLRSQSIGLVALPRELLDRVVSSLPTTDFNNLRLTCKQVESKVFLYWSNIYIRKKQFMISELSLQTLLEISEHPILSHFLHHLVIGLDEFASVHHADLTKLEDFQQYQASVCAQNALLDSGVAITLLARALANLPDLESINIRDFNSPTRYRDSSSSREVAEWRSYGSSEYRSWEGHGSHIFPRTSNAFTTRVFRVLLAAISLSKCTPRFFEMTLRHKYAAISDTAFATIPTMTDGLTPFFQGLDRLHVDVRLAREDGQPLHHVWRRPDSQHLDSAEAYYDPQTTNFRRFLGLTSNLTHLRLNLVDCSVYEFNREVVPRFFQWLALKPGEFASEKPGWNDVNPPPVFLPLRQLDLGDATLDVGILASVLKKFTELTAISLKGISLSSTKGDSDDDDDQQRRESAIWARFLGGLLTITPNLKQLSLRRIHEHPKTYIPRNQIMFLRPGEFPKLSDRTTSRYIAHVDEAALDRLLDSMWTYTDWARVNQPDLLKASESTNDAHEDEDSDQDDGNNIDDDDDDDMSRDNEDDEDGGDLVTLI